MEKPTQPRPSLGSAQVALDAFEIHEGCDVRRMTPEQRARYDLLLHDAADEKAKERVLLAEQAGVMQYQPEQKKRR